MVETPSPESPPASPLRAFADLLSRAGAHLDQLTLDLARDVGEVARGGAAMAQAARAQWDEVARWFDDTWRDVRASTRGVPRVGRVVRAGLAVAADARWRRLRALAAGHPGLTDDDHRALAARVVARCVALRGGVLKLGQVASCRPDLIGPIWAEALATLQDRVPPVDVEAIAARIAEELGAPVTERFAGFGAEALAAASLAQVHGARLADGRAVAVKVQLPGIDQIVAADVAALGVLAGALGDLIPGDLAAIAGELGRALEGELDYRAEAEAGVEAAPSLVGTPLYVPAVIASHSTGRVLTTDRVDGRRLLEVLDGGDGAERTRILTALADGIARQIFRGGLVHADPHPGNFLVDHDGRIAVLDWGCVLRLSPVERAGYARVVLALAVGDATRASAELAALGFGGEPSALASIAGSITAVLRPGVSTATVDWDAQASAFVRDVTVRARDAKVTVPRSFVLLGRVLGTLAGLFATYQPAVELAAVIGPHVAAAAASA